MIYYFCYTCKISEVLYRSFLQSLLEYIKYLSLEVYRMKLYEVPTPSYVVRSCTAGREFKNIKKSIR